MGRQETIHSFAVPLPQVHPGNTRLSEGDGIDGVIKRACFSMYQTIDHWQPRLQLWAMFKFEAAKIFVESVSADYETDPVCSSRGLSKVFG